MNKIVIAVILLSILVINGSFYLPQPSIVGAWHEKEGDEEAVVICTDSYIVVTEFNQVNTAFSYCSGGSYKEKNGQLIVMVDFTTRKKETGLIGTQRALNYSIAGDKLTVTLNDSTTRLLTRIDDGSGTLAGTWHLASRMNNGQPEPIQKDEETLKIVSGKRFQWITFDPEKNEFIGGGCGNYTYNDGKYTENIECYAKDSYKIGKMLSFDVSINQNVLTQKGFNAKGEPLVEEWRKE
ncbi:MAG: hypothetical protein ACHQFX_15770 [Chitinophagales bacterium]